MPVKMRPPSLGAVSAPPSSGVSVTDTMTLVVKDLTGREIRVKDSLQGNESKESVVAPLAPKDTAAKATTPSINFEQLRIGPVIGQGAGGKVRVAQHKETKRMYAVKYVDFEGKSEDAQVLVTNELGRVQALKHDNIVSSYEAFFRKSRLCVVLEWMDAGSMADVIVRHTDFPDAYVAYVARGLLKGLAHLHRTKTMHRDIKPANVLANSRGEVKVSDFGIAKVFHGSATKTVSVAGSTPYMSPEMITTVPYSFETDIWSAGMTVAECAIGAYPFGKKKNADPFEMFETVQKGSESILWDQKGRSHSEALKAFVKACLSPRDSRPSAEELLRHDFIKLADTISSIQAGAWFMEGKRPPSEVSSSAVEE